MMSLVGLDGKSASLAARIVLCSAVVDALSIARALVITGAGIARASRLVTLLRWLCWHSIPLTSVTPASFCSLASGVRYTYVISQASVSNKLQKLLDEKEGSIRFQHARGLADRRYLRPANVIVGPMQGLMGAANDGVEANAIAERLAELFDGKALELALSALSARMTRASPAYKREVPDAIRNHWERTDLLVTSCAPVGRTYYPGRVPTAEIIDHVDQMLQVASGDFGGIYLGRDGDVCTSNRFNPIGMSVEDVRQIGKSGGDTVLITGAETEREEITFTILEAGLMTVLITDLEFARRLLVRPPISRMAG